MSAILEVHRSNVTGEALAKGKIGEELFRKREIISRKMVDLFASEDVSNDANGLHTSDEFARAVAGMDFKGAIVHGALLFARLSGIVYRNFPEGVTAYEASLRFVKPVYVGEEVEYIFFLKEPGRFRPRLMVEIASVSTMQTACNIDNLTLLLPRVRKS